MLKRLCCLRLSTAGVIVGWLGVFSSLIATILLGVVLGYADDIADAIVKRMGQGPMATYDEIHMGIITVASIYLGIVVLNLLASAMLIVGTMKERHLMLLPWLINSGVGLALTVLYHVISVVVVLSSDSVGADSIPLVVFLSLITAIEIYIYYGIYSLYKHIQLTREEQRPLMNNPQVVPDQGNSYPNYTKM